MFVLITPLKCDCNAGKSRPPPPSMESGHSFDTSLEDCSSFGCCGFLKCAHPSNKTNTFTPCHSIYHAKPKDTSKKAFYPQLLPKGIIYHPKAPQPQLLILSRVVCVKLHCHFPLSLSFLLQLHSFTRTGYYFFCSMLLNYFFPSSAPYTTQVFKPQTDGIARTWRKKKRFGPSRRFFSFMAFYRYKNVAQHFPSTFIFSLSLKAF